MDAALNNYVALHYASRHMNWLHCFWGRGSHCQSICHGLLPHSRLGMAHRLPLYFRDPVFHNGNNIYRPSTVEKTKSSNKLPFKASEPARGSENKGVKFVLIAFFSYLALELTASLCASSYLVGIPRGIHPPNSCKFASLFLLNNLWAASERRFVADRIGDKGRFDMES